MVRSGRFMESASIGSRERGRRHSARPLRAGVMRGARLRGAARRRSASAAAGFVDRRCAARTGRTTANCAMLRRSSTVSAPMPPGTVGNTARGHGPRRRCRAARMEWIGRSSSRAPARCTATAGRRYARSPPALGCGAGDAHRRALALPAGRARSAARRGTSLRAARQRPGQACCRWRCRSASDRTRPRRRRPRRARSRRCRRLAAANCAPDRRGGSRARTGARRTAQPSPPKRPAPRHRSSRRQRGLPRAGAAAWPQRPVACNRGVDAARLRRDRGRHPIGEIAAARSLVAWPRNTSPMQLPASAGMSRQCAS